MSKQKHINKLSEKERHERIMELLSFLKNAGDESFMITSLQGMGFTNLEIIEIVNSYNGWCLSNE